MQPIQSMAVVLNPLKPGAELLAERIVQMAHSRGVQTTLLTEYPLPLHSLDAMDVCCVIGGDGTILGAVPEAARTNTAILGVNLGKLGFLATYTPEEIQNQMLSILEGDYCLDHRSLIEASFGSDNQPYVALNDVVIKSTTINLMRLKVFENDHAIAEYSCDGLIFATPTGSTAYNLSAGGPILHPQNRSVAMTPICAHTLSNRSFIFPDEATLTVESCPSVHPPSVHISADGRSLNPPEGGSPLPLHIRMANRSIRLIHAADYSHYQMLRTKLKWM